jgi:repressor LexA
MSNIGNKETLAKNLKYYMDKFGRTQKEMSEVVGVAASTFNDWMKAKKYPRIDKIEMLADYFGIKKSDLIEERITEEVQKNNDIMADIIVRMRTDEDFLEVVQTLNMLNKEQLAGVMQMLKAFNK